MLGLEDVLVDHLAQDFRQIMVEMVEAPDIVFHRTVKPANIVPGFKLLGFWDRDKPASAAVV
jgi:hypothetical protein